MTAETRPARRDWWVSVGMAVSAASAAVSSFSGLRSLAEATGWPDLLAPMLPLTIDSYAATSIRVWLAGSTRSARARKFARANAVGAILLSLAGNAVSHLIAAHLLAASWLVVLVVGAVPPVILGLVVELAVLRTVDPVVSTEAVPSPIPAIPPADEAVGTQPSTETEVQPEAGPRAGPGRTAARQSGTSPAAGTRTHKRYQTQDELVLAAREADGAYRAAHGGKPITRDALREALGIGGARATAMLRQLKQERGAGAPVRAGG